MEALIATLQAALAVAMATTFDDNIYLTGFFSETDQDFRPIHIIVGELLGFTALITTSFIASRALANTVPLTMIGWLGMLPILIGCHNLVKLLKPIGKRDLIPLTGKGDKRQGFSSTRPRITKTLRDPQTYRVSAITISNGGNNLSIYIPFMATSSAIAGLLTVLVCYLAVMSWLLLSFRLTRLPGISMHLSRHAGRIFPFVLMWLGFRILHDSGALHTVPGWN